MNKKFIVAGRKISKNSNTQRVLFIVMGSIYLAGGISFIINSDWVKGLFFSFTSLYIIYSGITNKINGFRENFLQFDERGISYLLNNKFTIKPQTITWRQIKSIDIKPVRISLKLSDDKEEEISLANFTYEDVLEIKDLIKETCAKQNISLT
jgi:hypothetical protein